MSSYYDCYPESNNTKVNVLSPKTSDIINNITGIFMLLTSIGVTFLIIFFASTHIYITNKQTITKPNPIYFLFLLTFACISIIVGLSGMYKKSPNTSIYGFSSFILIGVYTIFLFLSGKLKDIEFNSLTDNFFKTIPVAILVILLGTSFGLYFGVYKNVKKSKNRRINSQRKRQRNTAHVIFIFSVVGSVLFALFVSKFMQLNE